MKICFYTIYDQTYKQTGDGLVNSIKHFYPDIDVIVYDFTSEQEYSLQRFCDFHLEKGKELLDKYDRVISVDCDSIMCAPCPDFFDDYDMGVVQNNIPVYESHGGDSSGVYINAGLDICTSKQAWQEYCDEYYRRCAVKWEDLNEQNALNHVFHHSKLNIKLLEDKQSCYGITGMDLYKDMFIKDNELYLTDGRKLCIFHAAGVDWKDKPTGQIKFDLITNVSAREKLKGFTL